MSLMDKNIHIPNKYLDILINPITKEKLIIAGDSTQFQNMDLNQLDAKIENNIPIIVPKNESSELNESDFHRSQGSIFNYIDHYQKDAEVFDYFIELDSSITKEELNRLHQTIIKSIPTQASMVLDVGCGDGWISRNIVNEETSVISMDISFKNVSRTIQNNSHINHFGLVADVFNLPLADETMDCIIASEVIEHVANPRLFIEKLLAVLKKNGKLIITAPYNEKIIYHLCVHCNKPTPSHAHLYSFNEKTIKELVPGYVKSLNFRAFSNKYLLKLRVFLALKFLPYKIWNQVDKLANIVFRHPSRLLLEIIK